MYEITSDKVFVVGDIHGDIETLVNIIYYWEKANKPPIVFLGDYADRGESGVEVIERLITLKEYKNVYLLKGNHEDYLPNGFPIFPCSLIEEVTKKRGDWLTYFSKTLNPFFSNLQISAIINDKILLVHGGISSKIKSRDDLVNPTKDTVNNILWSDPSPHLFGEIENSYRGLGVIFGRKVVDSVTKNLGVNLIIRSHQPNLAKEKPMVLFDKVVTISSTSFYGGKPYYLVIEGTNYEVKYL